MTYRAAKFKIDDAAYPGITDGRDWNGWACPLFTRETLERMIADDSNFPLYYDAKSDVFIYDGDGLGMDTETFEGENVNGTTHYGVGSGSWCWCEVLPDDYIDPMGD